MNVVLISTYELGRQPFGLASPAAWLRAEGASVTCLDLSRQPLDEAAIRGAQLIAFYVPMHTATRLAVELLPSVRALNSGVHICFYGLYAPVNEAYLRKLGVHTILGGEFEEGLLSLAKTLVIPSEARNPSSHPVAPVILLSRQKFITPDRTDLPALENYAHLIDDGGHRVAGYTEASRGCKHLCRHCPIVPVYNGAFRVVQRDVVLEDIRRQVRAGAQHITFGDPDFFNGITHALAIVEALHREHPRVSYDVTIKVEHLLKHSQHIRTLRDTGCAFVTSAVESVDDAVLEKLDKGHSRADFLRVVELCRHAALPLQPTFVPFTPWTTPESYCNLLDTLAAHELVAHVAPIQLAIRLLIPAGSRLLELDEIRALVAPFAEAALAYPWRHADSRVDALCEEMQEIVRLGEKSKRTRAQTFQKIWHAAHRAAHGGKYDESRAPVLLARAAIPYLNEPWYC